MTDPQNPQGHDTFGGPDRGDEDEFAGPGGEPGPDTLGGPDRGDEDELRPGG